MAQQISQGYYANYVHSGPKALEMVPDHPITVQHRFAEGLQPIY